MSLITVRPTKNDHRVIVWERDHRHPGSEAFISAHADREFRVAETPEVLRALASGAIVRVEASPAPLVPPLAPADEKTSITANVVHLSQNGGESSRETADENIPGDASPAQPAETASAGDQPAVAGPADTGESDTPADPGASDDQPESNEGGGTPDEGVSEEDENVNDDQKPSTPPSDPKDDKPAPATPPRRGTRRPAEPR